MKHYILYKWVTVVIAAITILGSSEAFAGVIDINQTPIYNITSDINLIKKNAEDKDASTILEEYSKGGGAFTNDYIISLPSNASSYWLTFEVKNNNPLISNWVLNLGNAYDGTNGIANIIEVFSSDDLLNPIMRDGRYIKNKIHVEGQRKNILPLKIKPSETKKFLIYIDPVKGLPFKFTPKIENARYSAKQINRKLPKDMMLLSFSILILVIISLITKTNRSAIPFILFLYTITGFTIHIISSEIIPHGNNTGAVYIDVIYAILAATGLVLTGKIISKSKHPQNIETANILNLAGYIIIAISILGSLVISINDFTTYINVKILPIVSSIAIIAITIISSKKLPIPHKELYILSWVSFLLAVLAREFNLYIEHYLPLMMGHLALLYFSSLNSFAEQIKYRERKAQAHELKHEAELEISKNREEINQNQLLKIIKREKDLLIDLKKREEERVHAINDAKELADKANQTKSEFLAVISHEIRTPMTGIMGTLNLLKGTKLDIKQTDYVDMMNKAGNSLLGLLNDILDLSKAEAGHMDIEHIDFGLKDLMHSVVSIMEGPAKDKKLSLITELDPKAPLFLKGDPARLRQILTNLVSNALKFTNTGSVTVNMMSLGKDKNGKTEIYFSVTDTGIGIPKNLQKKLFKPYSQAKTSTSRKFGGTGLGLSICHKLVTAMGGTINIRNNSKKGTTFFFNIPFDLGEELITIKETPTEEVPIKKEEEPKKTEEVSEQKSYNPNRAKVLLVDDNEINLKVISALLDKYEVNTVTADSAKQALDEVSKNDFKMVFMDMQMPEIDGIEATTMIRRLGDKKKARTPIIAMTANVDQNSIARCIQAGMNNYIGKPIDTDKLDALINKMLDQDRILNAQTGSIVSNKRNPLNTKETIIDAPDSVTRIAPIQKEMEVSIDEKILNQKVFEGIKESVPKDGFSEMIKDLNSTIQNLISDLETFISKGNHKKAAIVAHSLAGVTANFGLKALAQEARVMQRLTKDKAPKSALENSLAKIKNIDRATKNEVSKIITI